MWSRERRFETGGRTIEGLPVFDGGFTSPAGISGRLGPAGSDAAIGLLVLEGEAANQAAEDFRRGSQHSALVAITAGRRPGLMAHNATHFNHPFGLPVLQVGSEERAFLEAAAVRGATATVVAGVRRVPAHSANVVARWPGIAAEAAPVVVTTPRSGWWHCASERGGGIAAWLEVARAVVKAAPARPIWFVAFSGHELGHLGSDAFLERRPEMVRKAAAWVHFGANVGGAVEPAVRIGASDVGLLEMGRLALGGGGVSGVTTAPPGRVPGPRVAGRARARWPRDRVVGWERAFPPALGPLAGRGRHSSRRTAGQRRGESRARTGRRGLAAHTPGGPNGRDTS